MEVCSWAIDYFPVGGVASPTQPNMIDCNSIKVRINLHPSLSDTFILFALSVSPYISYSLIRTLSPSPPVLLQSSWRLSTPVSLEFPSLSLSRTLKRKIISVSSDLHEVFGNCLESAHKPWRGNTPARSIKSSLTLALDYYSLAIDPGTLWTTQGRISLCLHCLWFG